MSLPEDRHKKRTLESPKERLGVKHQPLLNIQLDHVVLDELHLLLRVVDVLLRNLIYMMLKFDQNDGARSSRHLDALIESIRECGISFKFWQSREAGKPYDWTSLMGTDKKRLLKVRPYIISQYNNILLA